FLFGLSEPAGRARLVEELLLAIEGEFVPIQAVLTSEAPGVADDLAVALAEEVDSFLRNVEGDGGLSLFVEADPDAEVPQLFGEECLKDRAALVDFVGREDARV